MLPKIWIFDTYTIFIMIGVIVCFIFAYLYFKKNKLGERYFYNLIFTACITIIFGLISAVIFQTIFDMLKTNSTNPALSMTFFGGLAGGVIGFLLLYFFYLKKKEPQANLIKDIMIIAPACITVAHGFGRIGCFCAGCCHGIETDSILGVTFPGMINPVYPTQLFEAFFLFILSAILFFLAYKYRNLYTMPIYLAGYGVFRFMLEFLRGDDRGAYFLSLSPSQCFSIVAIIISIGLSIYLYHWKKKNN